MSTDVDDFLAHYGVSGMKWGKRKALRGLDKAEKAKMRAKRNTVKGIIQRLNEEADTARRYLDICELEVLEPRYTDDFVLKLLYELINKGTSLRVKLPEGVFDMTTEVHGVYGE